jgi:hypothetical protein
MARIRQEDDVRQHAGRKRAIGALALALLVWSQAEAGAGDPRDFSGTWRPIAGAACLPPNAPAILASPFPIRFDDAPGLIYILNDTDQTVRMVRLEPWPVPGGSRGAPGGSSRGRWKGDVLVIDTDEPGAPKRPGLRLHEEIARSVDQDGHGVLRDRITITDPGRASPPWTGERLYAAGSGLIAAEEGCAAAAPPASARPAHPAGGPAMFDAPAAGVPSVSGQWVIAPLRKAAGAGPPLNEAGQALYDQTKASRPADLAIAPADPCPVLLLQSGERIDVIRAQGQRVQAIPFKDKAGGDKAGERSARWDRQTLVIDDGLWREADWLDKAGLPHGPMLKVQERYLLAPDGRSLHGEATIDDPQFYAMPWTLAFTLVRQPGYELAPRACAAG